MAVGNLDATAQEIYRSARSLLLIVAVIIGCSCQGALASQSSETYTFEALGATWRVDSLKWTEIENHWLVAATVRLEKPGRGQLTGPQILSAFCRHIVEKKPGLPINSAAQKKIFRTDLRVLGPNDRPFWPIPVPVLSGNGDCPIKPGGDSVFISYPGALSGWQFVGGTLQKAGSKYRRMLIFQPDQGLDKKLSSFKAELACQATLQDPTVQEAQEAYEQRVTNVDIEQGIVIIIAKSGGKTGTFQGDIFETSSGQCIKQN